VVGNLAVPPVVYTLDVAGIPYVLELAGTLQLVEDSLVLEGLLKYKTVKGKKKVILVLN
jgi:hypothetical protein